MLSCKTEIRLEHGFIPIQQINYMIKYVLWNVNPPLNLHWFHPVRFLPPRYKRCSAVSPVSKPSMNIWVADVNSSRKGPIKRGSWTEDTQTLQPSDPPLSKRRHPTSLHSQKKTAALFVSPPWSALELSSWRPPAAAPPFGSSTQKSPHWRRARWISPWKPNRRKSWWETLRGDWIVNGSAYVLIV